MSGDPHRFRCACCGERTLEEEPRSSYEICPLCGWEQDDVQEADPSYRGGANELSLLEVRARWISGGGRPAG